LTAAEAQQLKLNAKVAVLSACNTGSGEIYSGEGAMGMSRAFLIAGAQTVIVSLWQVPSRATEELMTTFYKHLSSGLTTTAALRQARLELALNGNVSLDAVSRGLQLESAASSSPTAATDTSHPFSWSAFAEEASLPVARFAV
jgi:CHAT domain-containing protein